MPAQTIQTQLATALTRWGYREKTSKTHRYRIFFEPTVGYQHFYYLGSAGSLRHGSNKSTSRPVDPFFKERLLEEARGRFTSLDL